MNDCFEKGLLKRMSPSIALAKKSLKQADFFLKEAEDLIRIDKERMAVIALYNSFFHAARAMLFKDGVREKSHFCVARYLEEEYVETKLLDRRFLNQLDSLRDMRHETQYSVNEVLIEEDLNEIYDICKKFISTVKKMLESDTPAPPLSRI